MKTEILTGEILTALGFKKDDVGDNEETDMMWVNSNGITLYENKYSKPISYLFAGRTREDGSFKSGWTIRTKEQLVFLQKALDSNNWK